MRTTPSDADYIPTPSVRMRPWNMTHTRRYWRCSTAWARSQVCASVRNIGTWCRCKRRYHPDSHTIRKWCRCFGLSTGKSWCRLCGGNNSYHCYFCPLSNEWRCSWKSSQDAAIRWFLPLPLATGLLKMKMLKPVPHSTATACLWWSCWLSSWWWSLSTERISLQMPAQYGRKSRSAAPSSVTPKPLGYQWNTCTSSPHVGVGMCKTSLRWAR